MGTKWKTGWSWTKGYWDITTNPDGTKEKIYVYGGPFYFNPIQGIDTDAWKEGLIHFRWDGRDGLSRAYARGGDSYPL